MRIRVYCFAAFIFFLTNFSLLAQDYPHIPVVGHDHNSPVCWGYAIARAFGRDNHPVCPAYPLYFGNIPDQYFQQNGFDSTAVLPGDIIDFTKPNQQHVAYVRSKSGNAADLIILDQVENQGGLLKTGYTLQQTIDGVPGQLQARGRPVSYWRKKPTFNFTLQNKLGDNSNAGQIGLDYSEYNSPYTTPQFHWETNHTIDAVMHGRTHGGYVQIFREWQKNLAQFSTVKSQQITIDWNSGTPTFQAVLKNEYNVTFRNQFACVSGYPGIIIVNNNTKNSAYTEKVVDGNSVTSMACSQVYNHIEYSFSQWSDGNSSASRTITPTGNQTYTATFIGKPRPMTYYNLHSNNTPGQYVTLYWDEHPNSSVTQYQIWRKVKPQGGSEGPPTLLATVNRGTTSWVDYQYVVDSGYNHYLLWYDVRAYYSCEGTYANPDYISVFGQNDIPKTSQNGDEPHLPTAYEVTAFPNPFNPATSLHFQLAENAIVTLAIYDVHGRRVRTLVEGESSLGHHDVQCSGVDEENKKVASGVYFYQFVAIPTSGGQSFRKSGKLLLTK
jgi:hypothetical protein